MKFAMLGLFLVFLITFSDAASILFKGDPFDVESCNIGGTIQNQCNICVCTQNQVYECSSKNSSLCSNAEENINDTSCHPSAVYVLNDTLCVCNKSGQWPHNHCTREFKNLGSEPEIICNPNSYVPYDCNECRCPPDGKLDINRCTKNKCVEGNNTTQSRRFAKQKNVYGNCEVDNWYSLAPCQFCFCVNENKLVCNTGNVYAHKLELGAYNLSVCGKEVIREAIELMPDTQNSLRYGLKNIIDKELTTETATSKDTPTEADVEINVNFKESSTQGVINNNDEYYTDSEEETKPPITKNDDKSPNLGDSKNESEQEPDSDNETGVEIEADIVKPNKSVIKKSELRVPAASFQKPEYMSKLPATFNLSEALKFNLPTVFNNMFQMALRKSMVTVDSDNKCTPGSATILKCNACICINEKKLLCTNNAC